MFLSVALVSVFFTARICALPLSSDAETSVPDEHIPTLATDLLPPPLPKEDEFKNRPVLFLINLHGVKNKTGNEEVLQDDILAEVPDVSAPLSSLLLVVEADNEDSPVSLEELYKDLESEGLKVEKVKGKDGNTILIKVDIDIDSTESLELSDEKEVETEISDTNRDKRETEDGGITKLRVKKHICLKCKLHSLHEKLHGGGYGGGYEGGYGNMYGGGGGGCNVCGYQPRPQPPPRPVCNTCGGGGYPYGGGGGGGYSQASAQASASASAQSYSRY